MGSSLHSAAEQHFHCASVEAFRCAAAVRPSTRLLCGYVAFVVTNGGTRPTGGRRFPALEPERLALARRWWWVAAAAAAAATAVVVIAVVGHGSPAGEPTPSSSASTEAHLPPDARPLPGATGRDATSFGVLAAARQRPTDIPRSQ